jgi:phosphonate transport system substrate-binding protein
MSAMSTTLRAARPLTMASCMAQNADAMCRELARYFEEKLGVAVELVEDMPWQARERALDAGALDLCWICGLPYVEKADRGQYVEPCVAPVMIGARYREQAIYFSDVVVHADSSAARFADLRGSTWAYNEPCSHSGYNIVCHHLAAHGETLGFFARRVEAGAHQAALRLIARGEACVAAIDSTVLEAELARHPELRACLKVIDTLGPSPAPPWVFGSAMPQAMRRRVRECMLRMSDDVEGRRILAGWGIARWRAVTSSDYDPIRTMTRIATGAMIVDRHGAVARTTLAA